MIRVLALDAEDLGTANDRILTASVIDGVII